MIPAPPRLVALLAAALLVPALAGCVEDGDAPGAADGADGPNVVSGRVVDERGAPVAGAVVHVSGYTFGSGESASLETESGADGRYSIRVPEGSYEVRAYAHAKFNGGAFELLLHPDDGKWGTKHDSSAGIEKDFTWKLTGLKPYADEGSREPGDYHGALITVGDEGYYDLQTNQYDGERRDFPDGSVTVVTLTPSGPLIDGSAGKTLTYRTEWPIESLQDRYLLDVPIGDYDATAVVIEPGGVEKPLRVASVSSTYESNEEVTEPAASAPVRFLPMTGLLDGAHGVDLYLMY